MRKIKRILACLLLIFGLSLITVTLVSCENSNTNETGDPFADIKFENGTFTYDGNPHSIYLTNVPEKATVTYSGNDKVEPGGYTVTATIVIGDKKKTKSARMNINKAESVLTAEENQVVYVKEKLTTPVYNLNNEEQTMNLVVKRNGVLVDDISIFRAGEYVVEMYAKESAHYEASEKVTVNLTVKNSQFDVCFDDVTKFVDGNEQSVTLTGELPSGYTVEYVDNTGSSVGNYFATANIKDASGKVIETHYATLTLDYADDAEFEAYLDSFFVEYLEGDQLSVNIFCENPADFGLERYEASWYTYTTEEESDSEEFDPNTYYGEYLDELHSYKDTPLSARQKLAYNQIEDFLTYQTKYYGFEDIDYMKNHYIDQFGGYVADFGTYMEAYSIREKADAQDILDYIVSTETAFKSYLDYLADKTEAGYPLSDYTLEAMIDYLDEVIASEADGGHYYLADSLCAKIDATTVLTDEEKTDFKDKITKAISTEFMNGVKALKDGLATYMGKLAEEKEGYWSAYENGKDLYLLELSDLLGLDNFNYDSYIEELEIALDSSSKKESDAIDKLVNVYGITSNGQLNRLIKECVIYNGTPDEMMVFLKDFAKTIVPELKTAPEISIKEMDEASAKVSNAVAYYMKSALDNTAGEHITLNPLKLGDLNDVLGTLSHEGYPGHLYAYCYSKELNLHNLSTIMTSTAHGEGWATYVELKLYEYAMEVSTDGKFIDVMSYLYHNQLSGFLLETRIDAGIHCEGWKVEDVASYMKSLGYGSSQAEEIFNLLIETPASYAAYGYGKLFFYNLHQEARDVLGNYYDEVEFNAMLLSKGWTSLGTLHETYNEYITKTCHKYGITK